MRSGHVRIVRGHRAGRRASARAVYAVSASPRGHHGCSAGGHDGDRHAVAGGAPDEAVPAHDGQRGPQGEQGPPWSTSRKQRSTFGFGTDSPKKTTSGLRVSAPQARHRGGGGSDGRRCRPARCRRRGGSGWSPGPVRCDPRTRSTKSGVGLGKAVVERGPTGQVAAGEADDLVEVAVQLDDVDRTGGLVKLVDVLRDDRRGQPALGARRLRDGPGSARPGEPLPTDVAASPVPLPASWRRRTLRTASASRGGCRPSRGSPGCPTPWPGLRPGEHHDVTTGQEACELGLVMSWETGPVAAVGIDGPDSPYAGTLSGHRRGRPCVGRARFR